MKINNGLCAGLAILFLAAIPMMADAQTRFSLRVEIGAPTESRYYASLAESYDVPYNDVCLMHEAGVVDEDMPTILYIYTHSQYSLRQIYSLRLRGATWENLSNWCGVPLYTDRSGPPYGNAFGYYRHGPGQKGDQGYRQDGKWRRGSRGRSWSQNEEREHEGDD